jgi:hypothetical protein
MFRHGSDVGPARSLDIRLDSFVQETPNQVLHAMSAALCSEAIWMSLGRPSCVSLIVRKWLSQ